MMEARSSQLTPGRRTAPSARRCALVALVLGLALPIGLASTAALASASGLPTRAAGHGGPAQFTSGDLYTTTTTPMTPVLPIAPLGGITPNLAVHDGGGQWTCNDPRDVIANKAAGVLIGNCLQGTVENRSQYSDPDANLIRYYGGYVSGSFGGCGWLRDSGTTFRDGTNYSGCGPNGSPNDTLYGAIGYFYNSSSDNFGTQTYTQNPGCHLYGNAHPWLSTPTITDLVPGAALPAGTPVFWRYAVGKSGVGLSPDGVTGEDWIALYTSYAPPGYGPIGWAFAPYHGCFNTANLPNGTGGYWFPPAGV